jgi:hypothetical protein
MFIPTLCSLNNSKEIPFNSIKHFSRSFKHIENKNGDKFSSCLTPVKQGKKSLTFVMLNHMDGTVLMSETKEGMQQSLNIFQLYCDLWKLDVNINKTKVMVFSKKKNFNYSRISKGNLPNSP